MTHPDCDGKTTREILLYLLHKQEELSEQLKCRPCILLGHIHEPEAPS
jgi:hypothetical protein